MRLLFRTTRTGKSTRLTATVALLKVSFRLNCQSQGNDCPGQAARAGEGQASARNNRQAPTPHRVSRRQDSAVKLAFAIMRCMALTKEQHSSCQGPSFSSLAPEPGELTPGPLFSAT